MEKDFPVQTYINNLEILELTAAQIKKDFSFFSMDIVFRDNKENAYTQLYNQILPHISKLLKDKYEKLFSLLYRIDISEKQLKAEQEQNKELPFEQIITGLIIKRCLQKVVLRKLYS
jgi:hypothetical protein